MTINKSLLNRLALAAVLGTSLSFAGVALADKDANKHDSHDDDNERVTMEVAIDAQQALVIAQQQVPGRVMETELENEDGKAVWEVEIVDANQQEWEISIDAQTGVILSKEQDD